MGEFSRALAAAAVAFTATTAVLIAVVAQLSEARPATRLAPLAPGAAGTAAMGESGATTRTDLSVGINGTRTDAILVEPEAGAATGVVIVGGAGSQDRHAMLPLAEALAAQGFAALVYDKRTDGYGALHRDYAALADDAIAAAEALARTAGVSRLGAFGLSEGGWVALEAAARHRTPLQFAALASAPVVGPLEQASWTVDRTIESEPAPIRRIAATLVAQGRSVVDYLEYDPRPLLREVRVPVFAVWGADDATVPVNEAYRRLEAGVAGELRAVIVPHSGHDVTAAADAWLPALTQWLRKPSGTALTGVEPVSSLGVAAVAPPLWYADPRLHARSQPLPPPSSVSPSGGTPGPTTKG